MAKNKDRRKRIEDFILNPDKAILEDIDTFAESVDILIEALAKLPENIDTIKGEDGKSPIKGEDYLTDAEMDALESWILSLIPKKGEDYDTKEQVREYINEKIDKYVAAVQPPDFDGCRDEITKMVSQMIPEVVEKEEQDTKELTGVDIIKKLRDLPKNSKLNVGDIRGLKPYLEAVNKHTGEIDNLYDKLEELRDGQKFVIPIQNGSGGGASGNFAEVSSGIIPPASVPTKVGNIYVDTVSGIIYIAKGTAAVGDWVDVSSGGGGGVTDGDKGDITVSGGGITWTIDNGVVTLAKMANVPSGTIFYRKTAGAGIPETQTIATLKTDLALTKSDVGLGNVDNTSDLNKPVSTATQTALDGKVDESSTDASSYGFFIDEDSFVSDSPTKVPSQQSVKAYVDAQSQGLAIKEAVRLTTTAALPTNTYSNGVSGVGATLTAVAVGVLTIDGVVVALNNRVLVNNEVTQANNGIYICTVAGTAGVAYVLTRSVNMDTATEFSGAFTFTQEGSINADAGFVCTTNNPVTVGTTAITFTQFSGAGQITAGSGLSKTGNTLDVNVDGSTVEIVSDNIQVKDLGISTAKIANTAVTTGKIADSNVTLAKVQDIATDKILGRDTVGSGVVEEIGVTGGIEFDGAGNIRTSAFTGDVTKAAGGTATTIANDAITTIKVLNDAITNAKLANMGAATIKGNNTGGSADPLDLTAAEVTAMLNAFTTALKGLVPASGGGTSNFLRADGAWATPAGGGGGITRGQVVSLAQGIYTL